MTDRHMIDDSTPILVFQMGKVGSTSCYRALRALGYEIYQVHQLNPETLGKLEASFTDRGLDVPGHIKTSRKVRSEIIDAGHPAAVITMVR